MPVVFRSQKLQRGPSGGPGAVGEGSGRVPHTSVTGPVTKGAPRGDQRTGRIRRGVLIREIRRRRAHRSLRVLELLEDFLVNNDFVLDLLVHQVDEYPAEHDRGYGCRQEEPTQHPQDVLNLVGFLHHGFDGDIKDEVSEGRLWGNALVVEYYDVVGSRVLREPPVPSLGPCRSRR